MTVRGLWLLLAFAATARADLARDVEAACKEATLDALRAPRELLCAAGEGEEGAPGEEDAEAWAFDLTGYFTDPPDDDPYGSAILRADRGPLHLEARYNYEDLDTGSVWGGWTFAWSGEVEFSLVPMLGAVFGHTQGVAPGLEFDVVWKVLELYVEAEYVFDVDGTDDSFFYLWGEFTVNPTEWLSLGIVAQRTRAYDTDVEVDRGLLIGFHVRSVSATIYVFNLDQDDPYVMIGVGLSF
ncbi:MAG: hypothetical protein L6Q95_04660 [Planctomycetes bacterium]|nr:hypothetical protein [Planctomycetota bacterium]